MTDASDALKHLQGFIRAVTSGEVHKTRRKKYSQDLALTVRVVRKAGRKIVCAHLSQGSTSVWSVANVAVAADKAQTKVIAR